MPDASDVRVTDWSMPFFLYINVYWDVAIKPFTVIVPSVPKHVVGSEIVAVIVGMGLTVTFIAALGLSQPSLVFWLT